jgi:hypothetical protein
MAEFSSILRRLAALVRRAPEILPKRLSEGLGKRRNHAIIKRMKTNSE